ncbi:MAG: type I-U CRISPR-associated helicase/endonuclease Cas3 [Acidimicrobiaceae bacterium]|nr:type I-U CRISPR-associated helicase/endonuclease Cas3 [Acidimicrobiaceae bacterium]
MGELTATDFDAYFLDVHGYEPYPWQSRLTRQVLEGDGWPNVIDLPTGVGKTAVLDTAIFTLAARPDISPRRIVFVIDRRIVVDQVHERAERIRSRILAATDGVLADVRSCLKGLTGDDELLGVAALRGGVPVDGEWARRPDQPWVMVSTVDQFGSRLLFRGYGTSRRMRSVHGGLAGNDCLVLLDEVHLSRAFAATLQDISSDGEVPLIRAVNPELLPRRFKIVEISATPTDTSGRRFELQDGDLEQSPLLRQIAEAPKRATLVAISGNRPPHESVPKKVLELIKKELREDENSAGVIVNRVRTARETHRLLQEHGFAAYLVTGRMRPIDKEGVLARISHCVDPDRDSAPEERTVVVATQAIEVGADFSFDALISEAAPIDSLCQRLGRLDRRGSLAVHRESPTRCWVLGVASEMKPNRLDPVYGDATRHTWEELQSHATDGAIDVGPGAGLLARLGADALAPKLEAPLLLSTHLDAWSQTSPEPVADPPIAEFLHGKDSQREPDVSIAWRWDRSDEALKVVPLRPAEFLAVPLSAVRGWLRRTAEAPVSDTDTAPPEDDRPHAARGVDPAQRRLLSVRRWTGQEDGLTQALERVEDIKPGDLLIADPAMGGLTAGTWDPSARPSARLGASDEDVPPEPVEDLGDHAQLAHGRRATLRLDPRLLEGLALSRSPSPRDEQDTLIARREAISQWLAALLDLPADALPPWIVRVAERLRASGRFDIELVGAGAEDGYYVLVEPAVDPAILDEFDDRPSLTGRGTELRDHLGGVGAKAEEYGGRLGLSTEVVRDLRLAGELHDLGKIDSRFQAQMLGHDPVLIAGSDEPLAKSVRGARTRWHKWPPVRHEISSVALVQSSPDVLSFAHDPDLVLHLVGTHHGYGRPLPPIRKDDCPQSLTAVGQLRDGAFRLSAASDGGSDAAAGAPGSVRMSVSSDLAETPLALEMADRFWRLQERYGRHGLAWLEAIFRLADQQRSAEETGAGAGESR